MSKLSMLCAAASLLATPLFAHAGDAATKEGASAARGRYLVQISGCNDCHTPGYASGGGMVAQEQWLTGDRLGWHGPWGTTYPTNLRRYFARVSETDWLKAARAGKYRPPMPAPSLRDMSDNDLRSIYRFVHSLGAAGEEAPSYVAPGQAPAGPVVLFPMPPG
ncbi:cytochrome C [Azoarcus sp. L1K30]|uniref:cytochrome C n=1 Tax=Azoarcus sp. L1K30 TaxID=2820277 RepID=UPI001B8224C6|nr:cytochrome C [Azoarcus sp. L1K30]MBR0564632.1 cytochrome C [Azoarcus sp. L1K30]